jgi:hypothetical protein
MSVGIESIVRPFADQNVTPTPFTKPGAGSTPMVRLAIGYTGTIKSVGFSISLTVTTRMSQVYSELQPFSQATQQAMIEAAQQAAKSKSS